MSYLLYFFGFLPSIIWLLFYLRKDKHPEPNRMVLKVFFLGILGAFFAIFLEKGFHFLISFIKNQKALSSILAVFLGGALVEEYIKYLAVRFGVYNTYEMDEVFDILLYMIISALGFAALENILVLTSYHPVLTTAKAIETMAWRFISATFLHALSSALFGYFIAMSFYHLRKRKLLFSAGLLSATVLHGLYNFSIMKIEGLEKFILPLIVLIFLALFVSLSIKKVKNLKSICLIKKR